MLGVITKGTTIKGNAVGEGDQVDVDEDTFRILSNIGAIKPYVAPQPEAETRDPEPEKTHRKK